MVRNKQAGTPRRRRSQVDDEELAPGTVLTATLKGQVFSASVIASENGRPEVEFNGQRYTSPSAAGRAAADYAVNGWRFWHKVEEGDSC